MCKQPAMIMMRVAGEPVTSSAAEVNLALTELTAKKQEWATLPLHRKIALLDAILLRMTDKMVSWGRAGAEVKACTEEAIVVGEMMGAVAVPSVYIQKLLHTLRALAATGRAPQLPVRTHDNGQVAAEVFPLSWADRHNVLQPGATAELVLQPGIERVKLADMYDSKGRVHAGKGGLCAVLGAGNHGFLTVKDVLVSLFERGQVVAVKPHPQWFKWHHIADYVLQPLIQAGYVRSLYLEGVEAARQLLYHPMVDCVHLTGGTATHDAIVWGPTPEERARRLAANDPLLKVPITSELGCISPFIVAGWDFTPSQLRAQAENLATAAFNNCGCNCNAAKVLVLPGDWPRAAAFLETFRALLREMPRDPPFYPGIHERYRAFKERYPHSEAIEGPRRAACRDVGPYLPYLINHMDELPADPKSEYAFNVEPFAPVLTVVRLPTRGPQQFLEAAVRFSNEALWGTLSCTLVVHPGLQQAHPQEVQKAVDGLRYGVVAVNVWSAASFIVGPCTWGAFAGDQTIRDVGSGLGLMGNAFLVEGIEKAVYRTPIEGMAIPKPPHLQPMPMAVTRAVAGYLSAGWWGVLKSMWAR